MNMSNLLLDVCRRAGFEPKVPYRASYVELTKALVRQGLGVALVPKMFAALETLDGLVANSLLERPVRSLDLIYLREHPVSTAARALMMHVRTSVADYCEAEAR
jgi:LysR family hydrogen peroxide-inducible transcriptional activator